MIDAPIFIVDDSSAEDGFVSLHWTGVDVDVGDMYAPKMFQGIMCDVNEDRGGGVRSRVLTALAAPQQRSPVQARGQPPQLRGEVVARTDGGAQRGERRQRGEVAFRPWVPSGVREGETPAAWAARMYH